MNLEALSLDDRLVLEYALRLLATPYKWGGSNPLQGFDCSGLVIELLTARGYLPHGFDTNAMGLFQKTKGGLTETPSFGCLSFYGKNLGDITHVGFCISDRLMIEAGGGGSKTVTPADAASQGAWIRIRPIKYRKDFLATCKP